MPNAALITRAKSRIPDLALSAPPLASGRIIVGPRPRPDFPFASASHRLHSSTESQPQETGRDVTDHVLAREAEVTLEGLVGTLQGDAAPAEAWEAVRKLHRAREPVRVETEWATYREMVVAEATAEPWGRGARVTLRMREIIRVGSGAGAGSPTSRSGPAAGRAPALSRGRQALQRLRRAARAVQNTVQKARTAYDRARGGLQNARNAIERGRALILSGRPDDAISSLISGRDGIDSGIDAIVDAVPPPIRSRLPGT